MAGHDESHTNFDALQVARADAVELARGAVLAGRYEIETTLGRGGAGLVLRAHDRELREAVAIKVLRPELGLETRWIERLAREVKLARQLRHPNVCRVFDFEKADGHVFIVMELATGGTLRRELEERADDETRAARSPEARLADARAVAEGLAAIHAAGIAHRDVTPQNVLRMADGRLIVSDFGLATEISQTTTSLHGGTVAYMAPEIVRGHRGTFASDVWALGVVIHEIVFGVRPGWSKPVGGAMLSPVVGRTLARPERLAFEVSRACTAEDPRARPRSAKEVAEWLGGGKVVRAPTRGRWIAAAALGVVVGLALASRTPWLRSRDRSPSLATQALVLQPSGAPADWTETARVLASVPDRIQCLVSLNYGRTVRYVWGRPSHAEDLDVATGRRAPSPIVAQAYEQGCPDLSPDGKRLAFQGYTPDGRAYAYVSEHPDGRDAKPVVPIADPSMSSQPMWAPDGRAFSFDVDHQHMGLFSLDSGRTTVLPEPTHHAYHSAFRFSGASHLFLAPTEIEPVKTEIVGLQWPLLEETVRFIVPGMVLDLMSADGKTYFVVNTAVGESARSYRIDLERRTMRPLGTVRDRIIRQQLPVGNSFVFVSRLDRYDVWVSGPGSERRQLTHMGDVFDANPCGSDIIAQRDNGIVRIDRTTGRPLGPPLAENHYFYPACSPDGGTWFAASVKEPLGIDRCAGGTCTRIHEGAVRELSVSPDGRRIAFLRVRETGVVASWIGTSGGDVHDASVTETNCAPGWSSTHALWVSRRRDRRLLWIEVDTDAERETGRVVEGSADCADGLDDPASPVSPSLHVVGATTSEVRAVPRAEAFR